MVAVQVVDEGVEAGEGGGEDHARVVPQGVGQPPVLGQLCPLRGRLVAHHQGKAGITQGVEAGADGELGRGVEGGNALLGHPELGFQVEGACAPGELDDLGHAVDGLEAGLPHLRLDQAHDVLVRHPLANPVRDYVDELLAAQDAAGVAVVEDTRKPGQAEATAADHHGLAVGRGGSRSAGVDLEPSLEELGEETAEVLVAVGAQGPTRGRRARDRRGRCNRLRPHGQGRCFGVGGRARAQTSGIEAAQRLVEGCSVLDLRVVREERGHLGIGAEHVVREALENRRSDLLAQHLENAHPRARVHGVEIAGHVGDHGPRRG